MDRITQIIIIAFALDFFIGDPQNPLHPVRLIGGLIQLAVNKYNKMNLQKNVSKFLLGALTSLIVIGLAYSIPKLALCFAYGVNYRMGFLLEAVLCYFIIAANALKKESMAVYSALCDNDIEGARVKLSYIVGRDTESLSEDEIIKAAVETVAENLSDGVIAPLIFIFIGGAPLGFLYKAVNTLDSMIGYKNEKYEYFGKFAAKLDDCVNFFPARISALFMILATLFLNLSTKGAVSCYAKYRYCHKSPNSAQTESVCAGALGIALGGASCYGGVIVEKPQIGEYGAAPDKKHIIDANRIMYLTAVLVIAAMCAVTAKL